VNIEENPRDTLRTPSGNLEKNLKECIKEYIKETLRNTLRNSSANPQDTLEKHSEHIKEFIRAH